MWPFGKSAEARLEDALKEQKLTKDLGLDVKVEKKVAKVSGEVPNERYKNLIQAIANGINGINDVDLSGIRVAAAGTTGAAASGSMDASGADPSALAKAALAAIKKESGLSDDPIDVLQSGSTVVVRGAVDSQEELDRLRQVVTSVPGVTGIDYKGVNVIQHAAQLNETDDDGDVVYTVKSGDTLSHIALKYYGSAGRDSYMRIAEANGLADANKIQVGQKLKIPGTPKGPDAVI